MRDNEEYSNSELFKMEYDMMHTHIDDNRVETNILQIDDCNEPIDINDRLNINDMPQCLLLKIFQYIPFEQRIQHLLVVCKYWNSLGMDYSLFKDVTIAYERNPFLVMHSVQKYSRLVWCVSINVWKKNDVNRAISCLNMCENLKKLVVSPLYILPSEKCNTLRKVVFDDRTFDVPISDIINLLKYCKKIEQLELKYVRITYSVGHVLQELSTHGLCLRKLSFKQYIGKFSPVPTEINPFSKLEELRFDVADVAIDFVTLENLIKSVSKHLKVLKLYSRSYAVLNIMTNDLLAAIGECSKIEKLTFKYPRWSFCRYITDVGFRKLFKLKYLRSLVIHCVDRISHQAFFDYFAQPYIKNFDKIEVQHCSYFSEDIIAFIKGRYPHLEYKGDGKFLR